MIEFAEVVAGMSVFCLFEFLFESLVLFFDLSFLFLGKSKPGRDVRKEMFLLATCHVLILPVFDLFNFLL